MSIVYSLVRSVFTFVLLTVFPLFLWGQSEMDVRRLNENLFPSGIEYRGKLRDAFRYIDRTGENILVLSKTGIYTGAGEEGNFDNAELFAYCYLMDGAGAVLKWKVYDFVKECPVDVVMEFQKGSPQITDLDNDGIAEIWLIYKLVCRGDISPCGMKIIMYEGNQKYAMRGEDKVFCGTDESGQKQYMGGEYRLDSAFRQGPLEFMEFAKKMWNNHLSINTLF